MKTMLKIGVSVTIVLSLFGCQLTKGPSDEVLLSELVNSIKESLMTQDVDRLLSLYSESYSDSQGANKEAIRQGLSGFKASGFLEGLEVSTEDVKIVMNEDGTAAASQVKVTGGGFSITLSYTLVKQEGSWLISSSETQGI